LHSGWRRTDDGVLAEDLIDVDEAQHQAVLARRALVATDDGEREAALGEGLWRYGDRFIGMLAYGASEDHATFQPLLDESIELFAHWLNGKSLTDRADEPERRAHAAREFFEASGTEWVRRLAAKAVLALPEGHPERDVDWARGLLLEHLEFCRRQGSSDVLYAIGELVDKDLLPGEQVDALLAEGFAKLDEADDEGARREFRLNAIGEYAQRAIRARDADDEAGYAKWSARIEDLTDQLLAAATPGDEGSNLLMVAFHLDVGGREREAADVYRRVGEVDATEEQLARAVMREAKLRLGLDEHERVLELLEPAYPRLEERYLTAVRDDQIADTGSELADAVECLAMAYASLGRWDEAVRVIDQAKSLRSRYRRALREGPSGRELIDLERALYASGRGIEPDSAGNGSSRAADALGAGVAPHSRLLEAYREARPELPSDLVASPTAAEIAAALEEGEAAVILGVSWKATLAAVIAGAGGPVAATLLDPEWTHNRWLLEFAGDEESGWLYALGAPEAPIDREASLRRLLATVDAALGRPLAALLERTGARRIVIVPHFVLHLVPWWALASLAAYEVLVFPSAAQLLRSRAAPAVSLGRRGLVVGNPTGDLPAAGAEAAAAARHLGAMGIEATVLHGAEATEERLLALVGEAGVLHFTGHGRSDLLDPLRSALLVAPDLAQAGDPFPAWVAAAQDWDEKEERRVGSVPGVGRLTEERAQGSTRLERRIDLGPSSTLWALYDGDRLQALAELWTAGDLSVDDRLSRCALAVLSACESGAGSFSELDEYAGLPAAMQLAGVNTLLCTMWPVADPFAALYVDLFYDELARAGRTVDVVAVNRALARRVRQMGRDEARAILLRLADATSDGRAAFTLEAYASRLEDPPFADAWQWAAFYVTGQGTVTKEES
jgi:CHAT domain-containing protein